MVSNLSLRHRLNLLVLLAIIPLFGLSLIGILQTSRNDIAQATKNLETSALLVAANQQRMADAVRQMLSAIAYVPDLVEGSPSQCQRYFQALGAKLPMYVNAGILGIDGYVRCQILPGNPKTFAGDRPYFQAALASGDFEVSGYLVGRATGKPIMTYALPLKRSDGSLQAVTFATMFVSDMASTMALVSLPDGGHVVIMDRYGVVLASDTAQASLVGTTMPIARVREAIKAGVPSVFEAADASGNLHIFAFRPSSLLPHPPFFVLVSANKGEVLAPARQLLVFHFFALVLIAFLGIWMAWVLMGRSIVNTAAKILEATALLQAGALDARIALPPGESGNELTRMASGFNAMADSLQQREKAQAKNDANLRHTQSGFLAAQKLGRIGHWEQDMLSNRLVWSDELYVLFGRKPGEFDGDLATFLNMIHPDDRARYQAQWPTAAFHPSDSDIKYRIITAAGEVRWMHQRAQLLGDASGQLLSHSGVVQDITAQVDAEKDLQDRLLKLQHAAEAAQAITWHLTADGMLKELALQARSLIGAHQSVVNLMPDSDLALVESTLSLSETYAAHKDQRNLPGGVEIYAMLHGRNRVVRMTQAELQAHPRWRDFQAFAAQYPVMCGWMAVPLTGRDGQTMGLLELSGKYQGDFSIQDEYAVIELAQLVSVAIENVRLLAQVRQINAGLEQKVAERTLALSEQEALFRALAQQAPQVIWMADNQGVPTYFNHAWFDLVGGVAEDWTSGKGMKVTHPEDIAGIRDNWQRAVANRSAFVGMRRLRGRDGSYHVMSYRAQPVLDAQGEVSFWVGIDTDITEIKAIETALRLSNQELEAFSYSVSHDLRAPLNTIDGFSQLLLKQMTSDADPKTQHFLTRIRVGVAQMGQLIEGLLSLSQVSRTEMRYELVDLSDLSLRILNDWQGRDPDRHVEFHIEPGLVARGDALLLRVLMENLLANAWKFTSKLANANITVGQQIDAVGSLVFFVRDDGAGFDMAFASKLFVAFQRLHLVSEFPGSGVGLATVSRVVARHGGRLWVEASPDQGATVFFTLPQVVKFN